MPAIANGMIVCFLVVFIYAIIGISLFKGQFQSCLFTTEISKEEFVKIVTKADCLKAGGLWRIGERNFDNIFNSLQVLFEIITTEGWLDVMYAGIDTVGVGM
jgi:hypothetical protein